MLWKITAEFSFIQHVFNVTNYAVRLQFKLKLETDAN